MQPAQPSVVEQRCPNFPPDHFWRFATLRRIITIVFITAFSIALLMNYVLRPALGLRHPVGYDGHIELAQNVLDGNGFVFQPGGHPVIHRPPLYAALLMPGLLFPSAIRAYVSALNAALLAATVAVLFSFCKTAFNERFAIIAALATGLNPVIIYTVKTAQPAICQTFIYTCIVALTFRIWNKSRTTEPFPPKLGIAYGLLLLAAALVHGTMLAHAILLIASFTALAIRNANWHLLKMVSAAALTFILGLAPWTYRNYKVTGQFIPVVGNSGLAYFSGNARWGITKPAWQWNESRHEAELRHIGLDPSNAEEQIQFYGFTDLASEKFANRQAALHIKNHPADFAKKIALNAAEFYFPLLYYVIPPPGSEPSRYPFLQRLRKMDEKAFIGITLLNIFLVTLATAGAVSLIRNRPTRPIGIFCLLAWCAFAIPYFPFLTSVNHTLYTFGTIPIMTALASFYILRRRHSNELRDRVSSAAPSEPTTPKSTS